MSLGIADVYTSSVHDDDSAVALIRRALDLGITFLDTADIYGDSEVKVAKANRLFGGHLGKGIAGTPEQCCEQIRALAELGCTMLVIELFGRDIREPARIFAEAVLPQFR